MKFKRKENMIFKEVTVTKLKNNLKYEINNHFQNFIYSCNFEFRTGE